jgi:hypothetical protein
MEDYYKMLAEEYEMINEAFSIINDETPWEFSNTK